MNIIDDYKEHDCKEYLQMSFENMGDPVVCPVCGKEYYMEYDVKNDRYYFYLEGIR